MAIFLWSDLHFGHDREFIWGPRGYNSIEEHDESLIKKWNSIVGDNDDVYVLGDLMLGDNETGLEKLKSLCGKIHIVRGNHDSATRMELYKTLPNVVEIADVIRFKYKKIHFYLSHYPTLTANLEKESIYQCEINLFGHTHQKGLFYQDMPFMYNVGVDSHPLGPVLIDNIISDIKIEVEKCKMYL